MSYIHTLIFISSILTSFNLLLLYGVFSYIVAKEKNLPELHYVLYPRPAGFHLCLQEIRKLAATLLLRTHRATNSSNKNHNSSSISSSDKRNNMLPVLHDITIAYRDFVPNKRTSEMDFLLGMYICSYKINNFHY